MVRHLEEMFLICLIIFVAQSNALYFLLDKTSSERCFVEEHPDETLLQLKISFLDYADGRSIDVIVRPDNSPRGEPNMLQPDRHGHRAPIAPVKFQVTAAVSTFEFEVTKDGAYSICISARGLPPSTPWRVGFDISKGPDEDYYEDLAVQQELDPVQIQFSKLRDRANSILKEADYMKSKEVNFHKSSVQMNYTALWWPMVQMCILLVAGVLQVKYLKSFFKKRKLI